MKYTYNNKEYNVPDEIIDKSVEALGISIAEACELYIEDSENVVTDEQRELEKKASKGGRRYEQSTNPRKKAEKPRKVDKNKAELLKIIANALKNEANIVQIAQKNEVELSFSYENDDYTVKLTKHRHKKD